MSGYGSNMPMGHQPGPDPRSMGPGGGQMMPANREGYVAGPANSSMAAVAQLFARLSQEIEEQQPPNCVHFIVNFLCKHYPEHLHGFASIWNMDPDLERERHEVVNFFKSHKISTAVAAHFTNAGYDTLDTLTTLSSDQLVDVEAFNNVKWLPGHKVRLQQIFSEIPARIRAYRQAHPNQTAGVVGQVGGGILPPSPTGFRGAPAAISPYATAAPYAPAGQPGAPREYVVGVSAPVRVGAQGPKALMPPMATAGIDVNHDGRANYMVSGVDMNRDGIPDFLQQPQYMGGAPGGMMQGNMGPSARGAPMPGHMLPPGGMQVPQRAVR